VQTNHITRLQQVRKISGGYQSRANDPDAYDKYLTQTAMLRHGG